LKIEKKLLKNNFNSERFGNSIKEITIHHTAGKIELENLFTMFDKKDAQTSCHYGVKDEKVMQLVEEYHTAWTNSNQKSNRQAVTIEVSNSSTAPNWEISEKSYKTLIELVYDIAKRNRILPLVKGISLTWHGMYKNTACPGKYLLSKFDDIIKKVNNLYAESEKDYSPTPTPKNIYRVRQAYDAPETQAGAFENLLNAKHFCDNLNKNPKYSIFDIQGDSIYPL
jgi:N-acetylmuramoyl-L-alanine amidase